MPYTPQLARSKYAEGWAQAAFGEQNSEADAHAQLDYAIANGINISMPPRMYPIFAAPGNTRADGVYIGNWLAKRGNREKLIIASKLADRHVIMIQGIRPHPGAGS